MKRLFLLTIMVLFSFVLTANDDYLFDVQINHDDPELRAVFGALDVWSFYKDEDGAHHYRVAANEDEVKLLDSFFVSVTKLDSIKNIMQQMSLRTINLYPTLDELYYRLFDMEERYPDLVKVYHVSNSIEGRPIYALKISTAPAENLPDKKEILFTGLHHAREWITVPVTLLTAEFLLQKYDLNERVTNIVNNAEIWIMPMVNPDGYNFTHIDDRMWRKNRRNNGDGTFGVDPNRNYAANFGGEGASHSPRDDTYHGIAAFSEPETQAVRALAKKGGDDQGWVDDMDGFIDFHSYSQLILYPHGWTTLSGPNESEMANIADKMASLIYDEYGKEYTPQKSSSLYVASGGSSDWFYLEHDYAPTFTFELRPGGRDMTGRGFILDEEQIDNTVYENIPAALYYIEYIISGNWDIDTDENGNGVVDYYEDGKLEKQWNEGPEEEPVDDDSAFILDDEVMPDEDAFEEVDEIVVDDNEAVDNESDDADSVTHDNNAPDSTEETPDDTKETKTKVKESGCSLIIF